ncbi:hypothetical protein WR25_26806 [Diploscapter pachys]|uniref:MACPF domain-containing protein n=1 Tax=Diploscapter pachys TaxID=2018661 RepID=A0A2A2KKX7_9BILA|nr:hypothetical protein WR25_26806 [Diploscapter pachys]
MLMGEFISDYGTHIITQVELGASIEEYKFSSFNSLDTNTSINSDTHLGVWAKTLVQASGDLAVNNSFSDRKNMGSTSDDTKSQVHLKGELKPPAGENDTTYEVLKEAPLKYRVKPVCNMISNMESTPSYEISRIKSLCENTTSTYYKANERRGCTDIKASNFNFQANSNTDCTYVKGMPFGGLYATIEADLREDYLFSKEINDSAKEYALGQLNSTELKDYLHVTNPLMGNASCPKHYDRTNLMTSRHNSTIYFKYPGSGSLGPGGGTYITIQIETNENR